MKTDSTNYEAAVFSFSPTIVYTRSRMGMPKHPILESF
jgi:hypothetical protein